MFQGVSNKGASSTVLAKGRNKTQNYSSDRHRLHIKETYYQLWSIIGNLYIISPIFSPSNIVTSNNKLTRILIFIVQRNMFHVIRLQLKIHIITSVLKLLTYIITSVSSSYQTSCDTSDYFCLDFHNCSYSIYLIKNLNL